MATNGRSNGRKTKTKIVRGKKQLPIEYMLKLGFEFTQVSEPHGLGLGTSLTIPIRKGAGDRLSKYKKEDVAAVLRQLADVVETGDYSKIDPAFGTMMSGMKAGVAAGKKHANKPN